jgi:lipid II:glycine glycyltransferase (peptidoglycan interpeptide bridge formation enzyme)
MVERAGSEAARGPGPGVSAAVLDLAPEPAAWDAFVARSNPGSYLQTTAWAQVKAANGWSALRFMGAVGEGRAFGAQVLIRRPRLFPWAFAYAPRGPVLERWEPAVVEAFTAALCRALSPSLGRISHLRIEPEIELNGPSDMDGELRHALRQSGWRTSTPIQPPRTRQIDLRADETALWGDLRKKWRQYVNKAIRSGVRVADATVERLPEFYEIYRQTARRAGFIIRTYESYLAVWEAFARLGMARLLFAEDAAGTAQATLFLLRVGDRVIEPYGGMTEAGAEQRANYLLKWEAIRTSRLQGATTYDMWGLSHGGIEHFKTGFGGREIRYVGAWDLVLNPAGRLAFEAGEGLQVWIGRLRHGIRHVHSREEAAGTEGGAGAAAAGATTETTEADE